ncbi:MAG: hypothetical protein HGA73_04715, partial [Syntrophaceae bacterium]|nr:hypothetical protein [Syntrophaceae bacterium]
MVSDGIRNISQAAFIHAECFQDPFGLYASAYRMVLLPSFDVMKESGDNRAGHERSDLGMADALSVTFNEDDRSRIPGNGLAVAKPVGAFQLRFVKIGAAFIDELMGREDFLGAAQEGELIGFLFFDSYTAGAFRDDLVDYLDLFGHLVSMVIINELTALRTLLGTVQVARTFTHLRDVETVAHLDRMARYARVIALDLAPRYGLDDEFVEHVFLFAPLHDIGKIGVPDAVLLKPGSLDPDEDR